MVALAITGLVLVLGPFSTALAVHHALAEADHDGHQHSDHDLCQWVQHHTGSSLTADPPALHALLQPQHEAAPFIDRHPSVQFAGRSLSRGPPLS